MLNNCDDKGPLHRYIFLPISGIVCLIISVEYRLAIIHYRQTTEQSSDTQIMSVQLSACGRSRMHYICHILR